MSGTLPPDDRLIIRREAMGSSDSEGVVVFAELLDWARSGRLIARLARYPQVELEVRSLSQIPKPLLTALLVRSLSRGACLYRDDSGEERRLNWGELGRVLATAAGDLRAAPSLLRRSRRELAELETRTRERSRPRLVRDRAAIHLRGDPDPGLRAGGSLAHAAGLINQLGGADASPRVFAAQRPPGLRSDVQVEVFDPPPRYWDFEELQRLFCNQWFGDQVRSRLGAHSFDFVYSRYGLLGTLGPSLACELGLPLVLEYNGSETWIRRHWGRGLRLARLAERIEQLNLRAAQLVVVVSRALERELALRGIDPRCVLVNPNGVDVDRFQPDRDGRGVRDRLGLGEARIVGFVGTFEVWHGASVLAGAFERLLAQRPEAKGDVKLLMIGDGPGRRSVQQRLLIREAEGQVFFTGTIDPEQVPEHLAACDVLVAPHVPNADGSEFFGSPIKLFEYMAAGRAIVASDLAQLSEVLSHGEDAWLVEPADEESLCAGLAHLLDDAELRRRLGAAARSRAIARHTWTEHARRLSDALRERCG